jgi:hypothetical protein
MPYNQANGTTDGLSWATWPDSSVRAVEMEARAVEREARALERGAGGWPFAGPTFQELRTAAQTMIELCQALQLEQLSDKQRQLLADILPQIEAVAAEIGDYRRLGFRDLLPAVERLRDFCDALLGEKELADPQRQFLTNDVVPAINQLISMIQTFNQPPTAAAPSPPPRGERK